MPANSLVSPLSCIVIGSLGLVVLLQDVRRPLDQAFFALAGIRAYEAFTGFGFRQAWDAAEAFFWMKAGRLRPFTVSAALHFIVYLPPAHGCGAAPDDQGGGGHGLHPDHR